MQRAKAKSVQKVQYLAKDKTGKNLATVTLLDKAVGEAISGKTIGASEVFCKVDISYSDSIQVESTVVLNKIQITKIQMKSSKKKESW